MFRLCSCMLHFCSLKKCSRNFKKPVNCHTPKFELGKLLITHKAGGVKRFAFPRFLVHHQFRVHYRTMQLHPIVLFLGDIGLDELFDCVLRYRLEQLAGIGDFGIYHVGHVGVVVHCLYSFNLERRLAHFEIGNEVVDTSATLVKQRLCLFHLAPTQQVQHANGEMESFLWLEKSLVQMRILLSQTSFKLAISTLDSYLNSMFASYVNIITHESTAREKAKK